MLLIKKEYFSSLTYTIINTLVGLMIVRIIYENFSDVIDQYIIMSTLRQEGLFSFIGAGLINGALVYGARETIKEVNYFLFSRVKIIVVFLIPIVILMHFTDFNYIYILTIVSIPIGLIRQYLRNILLTKNSFLKLNLITFIFGVVYVLLISVSDSLYDVSLFFLVIVSLESISLAFQNGIIYDIKEPSKVVQTNIRQNIIQGVASSAFNNVDKIIFAKIIPVDILLTIDFAYKIRAISTKVISSITNVWFSKLHNYKDHLAFEKTNKFMGIAYIFTFSIILFFIDDISEFFKINNINITLFSILVLPSFFLIVLYKMRIMNIKTIKLNIVTNYRLIEGVLKSIIAPILVFFFGIQFGFIFAFLLSLILLAAGVYYSTKLFKGKSDIFLIILLTTYTICLFFVL